jgi:hypothetical protein
MTSKWYDTEIMDISVNQQPFSPNVFKFSNINKIAFLDLDVFLASFGFTYDFLGVYIAEGGQKVSLTFDIDLV